MNPDISRFLLPTFRALVLSLLFCAGIGHAQLESRERISQPLPADEAFRFNAYIDDGRLVLRWDIAEGYYLYRKSFEVKTPDPDPVLSRLRLPEGEILEDQFFGEVEVYRDAVETSLPLEYKAGERADFTIAYQGCAEKRYCYPVIRKTISMDF